MISKIILIIINFGNFKPFKSLQFNNCKRIIINNKLNNYLLLKDKYTELINNRNNLGFGGGVNVGVRKAVELGAKYFFILNDDVILTKECIDRLVKTIKSDEKIGIVGPKLYIKDKTIWSCGGMIDKARYSGGLVGYNETDSGQYDNNEEVDYIPGAAMLVKKEVFEKIGLFDERYFLYYEDVDFCLRAKKAGFRVVLEPRAIAYHEHSASVGFNSPLKHYYMARNHLLFVEKHSCLKIKVRELIRLPKTLCEHKKRGENAAILGIQDYFLRRFNQRKSF